MTQNTINELKRLAERYKKHSVTLPELVRIAETAPEGITERAAIIGIKLSLAREYGETEYFTIDDITEITGETAQQAAERIEAMGIDMLHITSTLPGLFS